MQASPGYAAVRVRIASSRWRALKARAAGRRSTPAQYADLIFSYPADDRLFLAGPQSTDDPDEEIYVDLEIDTRTRERLAARSEEHQLSLATYAGNLLSAFLRRHETDPRDLRMMQFLAARLHDRPVLSEADVVLAIGHCEINTRVRLPPGYFARWLHGRLQPMIETIERAGEPVPLTVRLLEELLSRGETSS